MQHPKVVLVGAGSFFFGRKAIWQMVHSPHLNGGTLGLVDTDAERLEKMTELARLVASHHGVDLAIESSTDRTQVLADADYVVLSFADRNAHFRGIDVATSAKYGVRMCSGDTIGPGGIMRTAREYPQIIAVCRDIERQCPDAWLINYINPTAVHGIGLRKHFPRLKSMALCDAQWKLRDRLADRAGVANDEKLSVLSVGPNHFTWLIKAEYDGRDLIPAFVEHMRGSAEQDLNEQAHGGKVHSKGFLNNAIAVELYDMLGCMPTVTGHTKEYVRFYQGLGRSGGDKLPELRLFDAAERAARTQRAWARVDQYVRGEASVADFDAEFGPDPAFDLVESMAGGLGKRFFINTMNEGAVSNMPDDAFLEMYCDLDAEHGPRPVPQPDLPVGVRGMCQLVLDAHELTAEAVYREDAALLRRAMVIDPLTNSLGDAEALLAELIEKEADALPGFLR